jgi:hypothetical protein
MGVFYKLSKKFQYYLESFIFIVRSFLVRRSFSPHWRGPCEGGSEGLHHFFPNKSRNI